MKKINMSWMGLIAVLLLSIAAYLPVQASVDVIVSGVVTDSLGSVVSAANVTLTTCHQTFTTVSDSTGYYTLVIPSAALNGCNTVELRGSKYRASYRTTISVSSLTAYPVRNLVLYNYHGE